jgi:hypothetical protein
MHYRRGFDGIRGISPAGGVGKPDLVLVTVQGAPEQFPESLYSRDPG